MSTKRSLVKILELVRLGRPVDWPRCISQFIQVGIDTSMLDKAVIAAPYGNREYRVTIINEDLFKQIESLVSPTDRRSRSTASKSGNSHYVSVSGAMLAVWFAGEVECINRIFKPGLPNPQPSRRHAIIIENEECFLHKEDTFQFLQQRCDVKWPIEDVEFIYGSGNSISNRLIIPYLKSFEGEVLCLLDVDFGGLRIYSNLLSAGMPMERTRYLIPNDLTERLSRSKRKASSAELESLSVLYGKSSLIDNIIKAIRHFGTTVEQESYRADR